ncbi:MAG: hypothetical protein AB1643_01750 [Patescibacteria group bacterium]
MTWNNLTRFLGKFRNIRPPESFIEEKTREVIKFVLNISPKKENIKYQNGIVFIKKASSIEKNEIFINKEKILRELEKNLGAKAPKDIKF